MHCQTQRGFSLLELMITIAIVAVIVKLGAPAVLSAQKSLVLKGAAESSYFSLQQARSHAVRLSSDIVVDFSAGNNWCMGITDQADCDCNTANSCTVDGVEETLSVTDFPGTVMQNVNFGANAQAVFDGTRGLSLGNAGSIEFANPDHEVRLNLNNVGRASICNVSGSVGTFQSC